MTNDEYIKFFRSKYGDELYDKIEEESKLIEKSITLKGDDTYVGIVKCLWLPKDDTSSRKNHIWLVEWNNGKFGGVEEKEMILTLKIER